MALTSGHLLWTNVGEPRLVEHYSPYCPHCRAFAPTWSTLIDDYDGSRVNLAQVNCVVSGGTSIFVSRGSLFLCLICLQIFAMRTVLQVIPKCNCIMMAREKLRSRACANTKVLYASSKNIRVCLGPPMVPHRHSFLRVTYKLHTMSRILMERYSLSPPRHSKALLRAATSL